MEQKFDRLQMAQKLVDKAGVSYEEARAALEGADWDLLEALVRLEKEGKMNTDKANNTESREKNQGQAAPQAEARTEQAKAKTKSFFDKVMAAFKNLLDNGNDNILVVKKDGKLVLEISLTVAILLLIAFNGLFIFLTLLGVAFGYKYSFKSRKEERRQEEEVQAARMAAEDIHSHHQANSFGI